MPMPIPRIAVNAQCLLSPLTGIGQYTRHLMQAIGTRGRFELNYFSGHNWGHEMPDGMSLRLNRLKRFAKRLLPNPHELSRRIQRIEFERGARRLRCDLYHDPNFLPYDFPGPIVTTVHDLSVVRCPEMHPQAAPTAHGQVFPRRARALSVHHHGLRVRARRIGFGLRHTAREDPSDLPRGVARLSSPHRRRNAGRSRPRMA